MAKKKNKQILRPWCWYCEREFEDEKVLMQHQKAKHFKCNMCPRRLNTAGGLAVHIQQVHKLEPENLPRIENSLPGRDGYEVEIFGMEGIPAPDVADYKRRKEIELGLNPGTISQPQSKRPKVENRPFSEEELRAQLEAHKALMGASEPAASTPTTESSAVYGAPPQAYSAPPTAISPPTLPMPGMPSMMPPGAHPFPPPPGFPGGPPFPPMPGMQLQLPPMPGFPPMGMPPMPPPGVLPPGAPPFQMPPHGMPFPPPFLPPGVQPPTGFTPPPATPTPPVHAPPPSFVPASAPHTGAPPHMPGSVPPPPASAAPALPELRLPNPQFAQTNGPFKKPTDLKWKDANFSPEERRAVNAKYHFAKDVTNQGSKPLGAVPGAEESRGKKRARAEDFL